MDWLSEGEPNGSAWTPELPISNVRVIWLQQWGERSYQAWLVYIPPGERIYLCCGWPGHGVLVREESRGLVSTVIADEESS